MLPLWTNVSDGRSSSIVYWIALRTRRFVPSSEIGLMPTPTVFGKADLRHAHFVAEEFQQLDCGGAVGFPFDAGVDVFRVFAKDHHVGFLGMHDRARHAGEPSHRTLADVQIEFLSQCDVQRTNAAAHRRRHRSFDADDEFLHCRQRFLRQPLIFAVHFKRLLARVDLHPFDRFASRHTPSQPLRRRPPSSPA